MTLLILFLSLASLFGLGWAIVSGHTPAVPSHFFVGIGAALVALATNLLILFHLGGIGKAVRETVARKGLDPGWAKKCRHYRKRLSPILSVALLATITAAILGGGQFAGKVPGSVHLVFGYGTFFANLLSFTMGTGYLIAANGLLMEICEKFR